ncbi:MAG: hypothetical protein ACPIOQ_75240, partial [Promethearchaeia archaeon]
SSEPSLLPYSSNASILSTWPAFSTATGLSTPFHLTSGIFKNLAFVFSTAVLGIQKLFNRQARPQELACCLIPERAFVLVRSDAGGVFGDWRGLRGCWTRGARLWRRVKLVRILGTRLQLDVHIRQHSSVVKLALLTRLALPLPCKRATCGLCHAAAAATAESAA